MHAHGMHLTPYLQHHSGVGRGQLVDDLAVAVLHHGLVFAGAQHQLLATGALLRGWRTAPLAATPTQGLALDVAQEGRQS